MITVTYGMRIFTGGRNCHILNNVGYRGTMLLNKGGGRGVQRGTVIY